MLPLPVIDQLCVTVPSTGSTVEVYVLPVEPPHTGSGPVILQLGIGFTVTEYSQPALKNVSPFWFVTVTLTPKVLVLAVTVTWETFTLVLVMVAAPTGLIDQV